MQNIDLPLILKISHWFSIDFHWFSLNSKEARNLTRLTKLKMTVLGRYTSYTTCRYVGISPVSYIRCSWYDVVPWAYGTSRAAPRENISDSRVWIGLELTPFK